MGGMRSWLGSALSLVVFCAVRRICIGWAAPTLVSVLFACTYIWVMVLRVPELRKFAPEVPPTAAPTAAAAPADSGGPRPSATAPPPSVEPAEPAAAAPFVEPAEPAAAAPSVEPAEPAAAVPSQEPETLHQAAAGELPAPALESAGEKEQGREDEAVTGETVAGAVAEDAVGPASSSALGPQTSGVEEIPRLPAEEDASDDVPAGDSDPWKGFDAQPVGGSSDGGRQKVNARDDWGESDSGDEGHKADDQENEFADLERAQELRQQGNDLFKAGKLHDAREAYSEAIHLMPVAEKKEKAILYSNRAACLQKLSRWDDVVSDCRLSIELDPSYVKAYVRRSAASEALGRWNDALEDLKKAIELEPSLRSKEYKRQAVLEARAQEQFEKDKEEMITKLKDLGNTVLGKFGMSTDNFKMEKDPNTGSYSIKFQN